MTDKKAINILKEHQEHWERLVHEKICPEDGGIETIKALEIAIKAIEERPKGEWVKCKDGYTRCDQCGSRGSAIKARFCHHCGANMRGGDSECHGEQ